MNPETDRVGADLYCKESGSTLRFLLPVVGALGKRGIFHPKGRLSQRPLSPLYEELCSHGMRISTPGSVPLIAEGQLRGGEYHITGDISSQFISGLLFALPILEEDSKIVVSGNLQSAGYVDMTLRTLTRFGIKVTRDVYGEDRETEKNEGQTFFIKGNQEYKAPREFQDGGYQVEGDWSNGAFWLVAGILGDTPIMVKGLDPTSAQKDKQIVNVIQEMGGTVSIEGQNVTSYPSRNRLKGISFDAEQTPDMIPAIALLATQAKGKSKIYNAQRLRSKESDRLHSISSTLRTLGADMEELQDGLIIKGKSELNGGVCDSFSDHRIAMMLSIASLVCKDKVQLIGSEAANKSYPSFFDRLKELDLDKNLERI